MKKQYYWGYVVVIGTVLASLLIWLGSMWYLDAWYDDRFKYVAKVGSMGATTLICWSFVLSTRFSIVERLFGGLDKVYKAHRRIGQAAFFLILLHPVFLAVPLLPAWGEILGFLWFSDDVVGNTGLVALLLFLVLIAVSLWIRLRYHVWKQTHHFFGLLLLVVIVHMILANAEIMRFPVLRVWSFAWLALAVFCFLYIRLLYRWIGPIYDYEVAATSKLGDITELYLTPVRPGRRLRHTAGQFVYLSFTTGKVSAEPHPFSISSAPGDPRLRLSVKEAGDWTSELSALRGGERARLWGPYGKFGNEVRADRDTTPVLIAGGIGLTPFLSMVKDDAFLGSDDRTAHLIYSVETRDEALYHDEIESLGLDEDKLAYIPHYTDEEGLLDAAEIGEKVGGLEGKRFFICGPAPMMDAIVDDLKENGVGIERIRTEDFSVI